MISQACIGRNNIVPILWWIKGLHAKVSSLRTVSYNSCRLNSATLGNANGLRSRETIVWYIFRINKVMLLLFIFHTKCIKPRTSSLQTQGQGRITTWKSAKSVSHSVDICACSLVKSDVILLLGSLSNLRYIYFEKSSESCNSLIISLRSILHDVAEGAML